MDILFRVNSVMKYYPLTGNMFWTANVGQAKAGNDVGYKSKDGYIYTKLDGKKYMVHRLAWLIVHGSWPFQIDHINGIRKDNRLCNLRIASMSENQYNSKISVRNTSGHKGVSWHKHTGKWQAQISYERTKKYLGMFVSKQDAIDAYDKAAKSLYGEFNSNGREK